MENLTEVTIVKKYILYFSSGVELGSIGIWDTDTTSLDFYNGNLDGTISPNIGYLTKLTQLDLVLFSFEYFVRVNHGGCIF